MVMVKCIGLMAASIRAIGKKAYRMGRELLVCPAKVSRGVSLKIMSWFS